MPLKTVSDLREDVSAILTGIDLDEVPNLYGSFERAVSTFIQKAPILEASGRDPIMLYDRVTDYLAPDTIFGGALVDIRPQGVPRNPWDDVEKLPILRFDLSKNYRTPSGYRVTFESRKADIIMRIAQNFANNAITLDDMTQITGWVLGGTGTGLAQDTTVFYHQPASLRFNLNVSGSQVSLTKTLTNALNISNYEGVGVAFLAIYMPNATSIPSVAVKIGSSPTDYYEVSETEGFLGSFYANDFLLIAYNLAGVAATGVPNFSTVNYLQVLINYDGTAIPNVRVGDFFVALPSAHEVLFYSPAVFINGTSDASVYIVEDSDEILFHPASYNIYVQEAAREVAKNQGGDIGSGIIEQIDVVLEGSGNKAGLYGQYRGDNPSEELRQIGSYYDSPGPGAQGYQYD